ncbi:2,3-bisphosphoglycerate-independent phosphoglycerate mutase, partial [Tanacetum coccineum]
SGISHLVLHGILDLGDGKLIRVFLHATILELLIVMEASVVPRRSVFTCLLDGHDVLDGSSVGFAEKLEAELASLHSKGIDAQVASGGGRMYVTMDRYKNDWEVVKRGWDAQVLCEAPHKFKSAVEAIKTGSWC